MSTEESRFEKAIRESALSRKKPFLVPNHPSPVAGQIEEFIGTDFGPVPDEVMASKMTMRVLVINSLFDSRLKDELVRFFVIKPAGQYFPIHHLYILNPARMRPTARLHETAHGFARNINPLASRIHQNRLGFLKKYASDSPQFTEFRAAFRCVGEGFAEWVAVGIGQGQAAAPERTKALEQLFIHFQDAVNYLKNESMRGKNWWKDDPQAILALKKAPFEYGRYFVAEVIARLEDQGMARQEAVERLLLNPPINMKELADPTSYADSSLTGLTNRMLLDKNRAHSLEDIAKIFFGD